MNWLAPSTLIAVCGLGLNLIATSTLAQSDGPMLGLGANPLAPAQTKSPSADAPVWKRITLGSYRGVNALRQALGAARVRVGDSADEVLGRAAFQFSDVRMEVDLLLFKVAELGFEDSASLSEIYRRADELGLQLCPAEVAPLLRLHYVDQPLGDFLNVAMRPIATYGGDLVVLTVANAGTGPLLIGGDGRPDVMLSWMTRFVFVRPQRIALPDQR
jgi:hypothetical protein